MKRCRLLGCQLQPHQPQQRRFFEHRVDDRFSIGLEGRAEFEMTIFGQSRRLCRKCVARNAAGKADNQCDDEHAAA